MGRPGTRPGVDVDLQGEPVASRTVGDGAVDRSAGHGREQRQDHGETCPVGHASTSLIVL
ncbi:hypothetical protein ACF1BE_08095 [Streptomyces sp. NPDC014991]|uniref:hypothetical protein n=1 Tax=Streptomyces sp. NPDC014991 TaxID=3364935 RepID=UPI0036FEE6E0